MTDQIQDRIGQAKSVIEGVQLLLLGDGTPGELTVRPELLHDMLSGAMALLEGVGD